MTQKDNDTKGNNKKWGARMVDGEVVQYKLNKQNIAVYTIIFIIAGLVLNGIKGLLLGLVVMTLWVAGAMVEIWVREKVRNEIQI